MHFIHKILCFEEFLHKNALFFKKLVFPEFRSIEPISRLIEIVIKVLDWLCVSISSRLLLDQSKYFRSIKSNFRSIEIRIESFLKPMFITCSSLFKTFQNTFLSLFDRSRSQRKFLSFSFKNFVRFFSFKAGKTLLPFLFHLFTVFIG